MLQAASKMSARSSRASSCGGMSSAKSSCGRGRKAEKLEQAVEQQLGTLTTDLHEIALQELVQVLRERPDRIANCIRIAKHDASCAPTSMLAVDVKDQPFHESVTKFYKVAKEFMRSIILTKAPAVVLTEDGLKTMERHQDGSTKEIFKASHLLSDKTGVPKCCLQKPVMRGALHERHAMAGPMLEDIQVKTIEVTTKQGNQAEVQVVNWLSWGVFWLMPRDSWPKTSVTHWSGIEVELEEPIMQDDDAVIDIKNNTSTVSATLVRGRCQTPLKELFEPPHRAQFEVFEKYASEDFAKVAVQASISMNAAMEVDDSQQHDSDVDSVGPADGSQQPEGSSPPAKRRHLD